MWSAESDHSPSNPQCCASQFFQTSSGNNFALRRAIGSRPAGLTEGRRSQVRGEKLPVPPQCVGVQRVRTYSARSTGTSAPGLVSDDGARRSSTREPRPSPDPAGSDIASHRRTPSSGRHSSSAPKDEAISISGPPAPSRAVGVSAPDVPVADYAAAPGPRGTPEHNQRASLTNVSRWRFIPRGSSRASFLPPPLIVPFSRPMLGSRADGL